MIGHWGLDRNPFAVLDSPFVSLPSHDEAVASLRYAIESSQPRAALIAPAGLGKSAVLRQAFCQVRSPRRRLVSVNCQRDGDLLFAELAEHLGQRLGREPSRRTAWRALDRALRLTALQGIQVVIAIEDCDLTRGAAVGHDLDSLECLGSALGQRLTVIHAARGEPEHRSEPRDRWPLATGLKALTRSQTEQFLTAKLVGAGATGEIFTPRAITRLHALSAGIPRAVESLATCCLVAGAMRGLETLPPDLVDGLALG